MLPGAIEYEIMRRTKMGTITQHDPDSLLCPCGNHRGLDDFAVCSPRGEAITQIEEKTGTGLVYVEHIEDPYLICPRCGRLYRVLRMMHTGQAFVEHMVDLTDPMIGVSLAAWKTSREH
ncbi:hypothetical protein GCM10009720_16120 [Yaniella flava]|uniref:YgiT-type zinc finger protein n=1 Tax=Yaniella flava TaxID=287930 RepID=A0ABN2UF74_9MICC